MVTRTKPQGKVGEGVARVVCEFNVRYHAEQPGRCLQVQVTSRCLTISALDKVLWHHRPRRRLSPRGCRCLACTCTIAVEIGKQRKLARCLSALLQGHGCALRAFLLISKGVS